MKTKIILFLAFFLSYFTFYNITIKNKNERIEKALELHLEKLKSDYKHYHYHQKIAVDNIFSITQQLAMDILVQIPDTSEEDLDALRMKLYERLKTRYQDMKLRGVYQYHFVLPDNRSFLRVHKPERYGDDLSEIRYSFPYVNATKKPIDGFEGGKTTHAIRYVRPLFDPEGNYLCAIEISFSTDYLQDYLTKISALHSHVLIHKDTFSIKIWDRKDISAKYIQSAEHEDYKLLMTDQHTIQRCILDNAKNLEGIKEKIHANMKKDKPFALYTKVYSAEGHGGERHMDVVSFLPIKSMADKTMAWIASYEKDEFIPLTFELIYGVRIASFILLATLFFLIYKALQQQQRLRKMNETLADQIELEVAHRMKTLKEKQEQETLLIRQSKMAAMGEMIGVIAHQWKQPINAIAIITQGLNERYEYGELDAETLKADTDSILSQTKFMTQTVDDFRNFFKPAKELQVFTACETVQNVYQMFKGQFQKQNVQVIIHPHEHFNALGYPNEFKQVVLNILNNAKDAIAEKNIREGIIECFFEIDDECGIIRIRDNGGGIPENLLPDKIFESYMSTKGDKGTGIGLYISKTIIESSMSGKLWVHNVKEGAEFVIELPLARLKEADQQ